MKKLFIAVLIFIGGAVLVAAVRAQSAPAAKPTIASVLDSQLSTVEREVVGAAEAMPEDKYSFAPTTGEFKGVRTFGEQVKHIAAANYRFFDTILGEKSPANESGPDALKTKAQIVQYLKDSFALGHRAIATITPENAAELLADGKSTRLQYASMGCWHPMDHYGQMVEYLRMNGIIPPASRQ
ncbi:MAG: DinB family protein [Candidatus Acidiferrales bacterium]